MKREYADYELRALILDWLVRRGRWGAHYYPLDTLVNRLSHAVKNNGRRVRRNVNDLLEEGYILAHKKGETISLNPTRSRDIAEYIRRVMKV
jgi:hypothetical protein